jgi:hypothetical protein
MTEFTAKQSQSPIDGEYIEDPVSHLSGTQQSTLDNADGTLTIVLKISPKDLPEAYVTSPDGSLWRLTFHEPANDICLNCVRQTIKDGPKQTVLLRLQILPYQVPFDIIWGRSGSRCSFSLQMLAGRHPYPHFIQRKERAACFRRSIMLCSEPTFAAWLRQTAQIANYPTPDIPHTSDLDAIDDQSALAMQTAETLCRLAQIHSRRDILTSNLAAERVERIIRSYREWIWNNRASETSNHSSAKLMTFTNGRAA